MPDLITEADLLAYVDDQLGAARCIKVEDYLAHNPAAAMLVMAELKDRDALFALGSHSTRARQSS